MVEITKATEYFEGHEIIWLVVELEMGEEIIQFVMSKASKTKGFLVEPNFDCVKDLKRPQ